MKKIFTLGFLLLLSWMMTVKAQQASPVLFSSGDTSDEHWYYVYFVRAYTEAYNNRVWAASDTSMLVHQYPMLPNAHKQQWKFIGDEAECYIVNRATGENVIFSDIALEDITGVQTPANSYYLGIESPTMFYFSPYPDTGNWTLIALGTT
ncbi:MAG: hypothetical protein LBB64_03285, partial [Dysgonamonadaceae bacterium]|nr:hypothetical protein [Dysgonamonadaceae bacterium]